MAITSLDHLVLTITDETATRRFYVDGLAMRWNIFADGRHALAFGDQKINIHYHGREFEPRSAFPTPGSGDICLLTDEPLDVIRNRMTALRFPVLEGPVQRTGATSTILSLYFRDPDGNLIEVARPVE